MSTFTRTSSPLLSIPFALLGILALSAPACDDHSSDTEVGEATFSLTSVPPDVHCLRITAATPARTLERTFDLTSTEAFSAALTGVPLGTVVFSAEAFTGACPDLTASTLAAWVSDPETGVVVLGRSITVTLVMHRNGRAKVAIDFPDEPACTAAHLSCTSSSACCSHLCSKGICAAEADGGAQAGADAGTP